MRSRWGLIRNAAVVLGTSVFTGACYSYVPASFNAVPIGEGVRLYLSEAGLDSLRRAAGDAIPSIGDRPVVSGILVRRDANDLSLRIPVATRQSGFHETELDQRVSLPVADLIQVEQRKLSTAKTALAVAASAVVLTTLVVTVMTGARQPIDTGNPPSDNAVIP
jgi:hypothetical protein